VMLRTVISIRSSIRMDSPGRRRVTSNRAPHRAPERGGATSGRSRFG
jgi:hypothetical protein